MKILLTTTILCASAFRATNAETQVAADAAPAEPASARVPGVVSLVSLLEDMIEPDLLARWPEPAFTCKQASSYDRATVAPDKPGWFANNDQNQFFHTEENQGRKEHVMLDADGPGCIVRFWLTTDRNKKGILRSYLDGEAIYGTRPWNYYAEGNDIRYTHNKDGRPVYAISLHWPGERLVLRRIRPREGTTVNLLGVTEPLKWKHDEARGLVIELPSALQQESARPCRQAYVFKIEGEPVEPPRPNADFNRGPVKIRFQPKTVAASDDYWPDYGEEFGDRGHGLRYGWSRDHTAETRLRTADQQGGTLCHFLDGQAWEIAVANGSYEIAISVGDAGFGSRNTIRVEGKEFCKDLALHQATLVVGGRSTVTDGRLTIDADGSTGRLTKINFVEIRRRDWGGPSRPGANLSPSKETSHAPATNRVHTRGASDSTGDELGTGPDASAAP